MKSDFAQRMGLLRQEKGLSQRQAAAKLGISQAVLSHYENGTREPKFEFVLSVCDFYKVTADYLLGRTAERKPGEEILSGRVRDVLTELEVLKLEEKMLIDKIADIINE